MPVVYGYFGVAPSIGASCVAIGLRLSLSGSTLGLLSQGCEVFGSANAMRLALRTPVSLPCGAWQLAAVFSGKSCCGVVEVRVFALHLVEDRHGPFVTDRARERIVGLEHQALMDRSVAGSNGRCGTGEAGKEDQERLQRERSGCKRLWSAARLVRSVVSSGPASVTRAADCSLAGMPLSIKRRMSGSLVRNCAVTASRSVLNCLIADD